MKKILRYVNVLLIASAILVSIYYYPRLPEEIITHWNADGVADGYGSRLIGVGLMPIVMVVLYGLMKILPKADPFKENWQYFESIYRGFISMMLGFFLYIHIITLLINDGLDLDITLFVLPFVSIIFIFIGLILPKIKRNWFMGIRTPWTISSEHVWDKTHRMGRILFIVSGVVSLFSIIDPAIGISLFIGLLLFSVVFLFLYSYLVYKTTDMQS